MNTFEKIQSVLVDKFDKDVNKIQLTTSFKDEMDVDSLEFVEIMMEIEDQFDISIDDEVAEKFVKIQDLVEYIENNQ